MDRENVQDAFEHNKGQISAIYHWIFCIFSSGCFPCSPSLLSKTWRNLPDFRAEKKRRIVSRLWLSWFLRSRNIATPVPDVIPGHLRPVILKPVGRIFEISGFETDTGKTRKMRKVPLTPEKQGSEEIPKSKNAENAENADTKTRKMRKMRMTGFSVTGFR